MAHPLDRLIDQIVAQSIADGDMDNLPGAGKPLPPVDKPQDALLSRMMTQAKAKPFIVDLKEQITAAAARLTDETDPVQRKVQMQRLADLQTRLAIEVEAIRKYG